MMILHHDYPSAGSLRAVLTLGELAGQGYDVEFHGIDVMGLASSIPATLDDIRDWDLNRRALAELGWVVGRPRRHPPTLAAHMVEEAIEDDERATRWRMACYRAHWLEGRDIGEVAVLRELAADADVDPEQLAAHVEDREAAAAARRRMLAARGDGVGGVPVLEVNGSKVSPFIDVDELKMLAGL
jgi:2-hydroxychromene-2-carboxylate isomerase